MCLTNLELGSFFRFGQRCGLKTLLIGCALLLLSYQVQAQDHESATSNMGEKGTYDLTLTEPLYPDEGEPDYGPTDAETDLNASGPKRGSIFGDVVPKKYFQWKQDLYTNHNLKLGFFYQMLYMNASDTAPFASNDTALGDWWGFDAKWTPLNKGEDYEGSLVLVAAARDSVGSHAVPAQYGINDLGSGYSVNFEFTKWDFAVEELYWEQWFGKDNLMVRGGLTAAGTMINPFRFKDGRTSFTATPLAFHESIPSPAQGPGFAAKWWPIKGSEFYITGVLNDANGNPSDGDFLGINLGSFSKHEFFYALEFGSIWKKKNGEFNRLFLTTFYVDEISRGDPVFNEAGGGFKLSGSLQQGKFVEFASYTYNEAKGGALATFGKQTVTAGAAYLRPFDIQGEIGMAIIWFEPLDLVPGTKLRNQTGYEFYWKILLTPNLWITPGFQYIWNPVFNPTEDKIFIPQFKFRLAF